MDIQKKLPGFELAVKLEAKQEIIGILGASGSGKSMLLRCIAGLVKPDAGKIIVNGKTLFAAKKKINVKPRERKVGFLFQNYALFPHLTVSENIAFGLDGWEKAAKEEKIAALLEKFHLTTMEKRYPNQISGGQQQRVALARAMAGDPEILLLDEPFSALDEHLKGQMLKEMLAYLKDFSGNTLYVTHNMEEAYSLCQRIAILKAGKLEVFAAKEELFAAPVSLETAKITGCKNLVKAKRRSDSLLELQDWGIRVKTASKVTVSEGFAGIRANQLRIATEAQQENCFQMWIADENTTPFRSTLYLKIGTKPASIEDFHLEWEVSPEEMREITKKTQPLQIYLDPNAVFFVKK